MLDSVAYSSCPVIPLSGLTIDRDGVASGEVQSLHASVFVSRLIVAGCIAYCIALCLGGLVGAQTDSNFQEAV